MSVRLWEVFVGMRDLDVVSHDVAASHGHTLHIHLKQRALLPIRRPPIRQGGLSGEKWCRFEDNHLAREQLYSPTLSQFSSYQ